MARKLRSIERDVFYVGCFLLLLIIVVFGTYLSLNIYNISVDAAKNNIEESNRQVSIYADSYFSEMINTIEVLAKSPDIIGAMDGDEAQRERVLTTYKNIAIANENIAYVYSGYLDGFLLINDYEPPPGYVLTARPWYVAAMEQRPGISSGLPYQEANTEEWLVSQSKALFDDEGNYTGVIAIDGALTNIMMALGQRHVYDSQRSFIIDNEGRYIVHLNEDYLGQTLAETPGLLNEGQGSIAYTYDDKGVWAHYSTMGSTGWTVITAVDRWEILQPIIARAIYHIFIAILLAVFVVMLQSKILGKRFASPLLKLQRRIAAITEGEVVDDVTQGKYENEEIAAIASNIEQLTQRSLNRTANKLAQEKQLLETTLMSVGDGVISTDRLGNITLMNKVAEQLTGWKYEEAKGRPIAEVFNVVDEATHKSIASAIKNVLNTKRSSIVQNYRILTAKDGLEQPIEDSVAPIIQENGDILGIVLVFRDFSAERKKQEEILFLSYHDQLTGLHNRRFYEQALRRLDTKSNLPLSIVMGDLNGLKLINDSFGHEMGDKLLTRAAEIIKRGCRVSDIVARLGGDEFVIVLPKTNTAEVELITERIKSLFAKEKVGPMTISVSFGFGTKHDEGEDIAEILKNTEDEMYRNKLYESLSMRSKTIDLIMNTLYEKSSREMQHSQRVGELCEAIAVSMNLEQYKVNQTRLAGLMHDIGKIVIGEQTLNKPAQLANQEWEDMKRHPEIGYRILTSVNEFSEVAAFVLEHQERWDGKGYPRGLKGEEISLQARIIAIADAYDAMTSIRPYKTPLSKEMAIEELRRNAGKQFDAGIVKVFIDKVLAKQDNEFANNHGDGSSGKYPLSIMRQPAARPLAAPSPWQRRDGNRRS